MGDRTSVTLTIPSVYKEAALAIFEREEDQPNDSFHNSEATNNPHFLCHFTWYEVNYGTLPHLDALEKAGIPFESDWDSGSEYGPGTETCRFTPDGDAVRKEVANEYLNPDLSRLIALLDEPEALKKYILDHKEKVTSLPWDDQVEYGKRYRLKQLIAHTEE
jgi:hypothetical protein